MRFVMVPDSFKGTAGSREICEVMCETARARFPGCEADALPVADGGEGSVDAFIAACGGRRVEIRAEGPFFEPVDAFYGMLGDTAVIEMAACAGLPLAAGRLDVRRATTFGVGRLIGDAVDRGARRVIVGLGGSATIDGGCGAACALGAKFFDADGREFVPSGGSLSRVTRVDVSGMKDLGGVEIVAMCDVDAPVCGPNGAARVFGPQKGADEDAIRETDAGLGVLCGVVRRDLGIELSDMPGGGAAGGMGAGMRAFFGAELRPGIETVLDISRFDERARGADLVLTGEGRLDSQSLRGKVVAGVGRRCARLGVPVVAIVGGAGEGAEAIYDAGISAVFTTNRLPQDLAAQAPRTLENIAFAVDNALRLIAAMRAPR